MKKRSVILIGLAVVAFVAAVLALRVPDPQAVLRRAQSKLAAEKSMRVDIAASLVGTPKELGASFADDATGIDVTVRADLDRDDPLKPASVSTFEIKQRGGGTSVRLAGEARRKDGLYYLHLDAADGFAGSAQKLIGVWAKTDRPLTERLVPPSAAALSERPLDAASIQAIRQALAAVSLFKVDKTLPVEKVGDQDAYHYLVEADMQAVSALLMKVRQLRSPAPLSADDVLAVTAQLVQWGKPIGEVWIGKHDGRVLKTVLQTDLGDGSGAVSLTAQFSRYGQPVAVQAPQAVDLDDLLGVMAGNGHLSLAGDRPVTTGSATAAAPTPALPPVVSLGAKDSDGDGLADTQEFFYGSDAWNPDTDGDGWTDGYEVEKGMNPNGPGTLFGFGL